MKWALCGICLLLTGCWWRQDMHDQPKYKTFRPSRLFADGRSERPFVEGTVARGHLKTDRQLNFGKIGKTEEDIDTLPYPVTRDMLQRGKERYEIFCLPCHGFTGAGNGMIVQRGLYAPPSYHTPRLREAKLGHFYDVITNGYGSMYSYASRIPVNDRWAIVAYIRALQLSQNAPAADVPENERAKLAGGQQ